MITLKLHDHKTLAAMEVDFASLEDMSVFLEWLAKVVDLSPDFLTMAKSVSAAMAESSGTPTITETPDGKASILEWGSPGPAAADTLATKQPVAHSEPRDFTHCSESPNHFHRYNWTQEASGTNHIGICVHCGFTIHTGGNPEKA